MCAMKARGPSQYQRMPFGQPAMPIGNKRQRDFDTMEAQEERVKARLLRTVGLGACTSTPAASTKMQFPTESDLSLMSSTSRDLWNIFMEQQKTDCASSTPKPIDAANPPAACVATSSGSKKPQIVPGLVLDTDVSGLPTSNKGPHAKPGCKKSRKKSTTPKASAAPSLKLPPYQPYVPLVALYPCSRKLANYSLQCTNSGLSHFLSCFNEDELILAHQQLGMSAKQPTLESTPAEHPPAHPSDLSFMVAAEYSDIDTESCSTTESVPGFESSSPDDYASEGLDTPQSFGMSSDNRLVEAVWEETPEPTPMAAKEHRIDEHEMKADREHDSFTTAEEADLFLNDFSSFL